jgi:basic amino acid/polyamine antiporter, APA family
MLMEPTTSPPETRPPGRAATLERTLGFRELVLLVVGVVIGSGIFIVPAAVLRATEGAYGLALIVWFVAGVLSLLGALTYGELGVRRPHAGGLYVFLRDAFGARLAFVYGWALFFVIGSGAIAALSAAFAAYLGTLVPLSPLAAKAVSLLMIMAVVAINVRGTRGSASVQNWTTAFKAIAILLMSLLLIAAAGEWTEVSAPWPETFSLGVLSAVGVAMIGVLWAYEGWQYATFSVGEIRDAQRVFPRGIALGTLILVVLYMLANIGYIAALGPEAAAQAEGIAAIAVSAMYGPNAGRFVAAAICVSIFSAANAVVLTTPRVYFAMARDGVFFRRLSEVHPTRGTPAFAILATGAWALLLAASGTFDQLLTYVVFAGWIFYGLAAASLFPIRRREGIENVTFRVPGYPWTPLLFVASAAAIVGNALFTQPARAAIGLAVVLAGLPAYEIWNRRRKAAAP